jgi:hypothetical protein
MRGARYDTALPSDSNMRNSRQPPGGSHSPCPLITEAATRSMMTPSMPSGALRHVCQSASKILDADPPAQGVKKLHAE